MQISSVPGGRSISLVPPAGGIAGSDYTGCNHGNTSLCTGVLLVPYMHWSSSVHTIVRPPRHHRSAPSSLPSVSDISASHHIYLHYDPIRGSPTPQERPPMPGMYNVFNLLLVVLLMPLKPPQKVKLKRRRWEPLRCGVGGGEPPDNVPGILKPFQSLPEGGAVACSSLWAPG